MQKELLEDLIDGFELQHEDNPNYGTVIIHRCCIYKGFKTYSSAGEYIHLNQALVHVLETNEHYQISDGYCPKCNPLR